MAECIHSYIPFLFVLEHSLVGNVGLIYVWPGYCELMISLYYITQFKLINFPSEIFAFVCVCVDLNLKLIFYFSHCFSLC